MERVMPITFREVLKFPQQRKECFLNDAEFEQFCGELASNLTLEPEVPGADGARKIRSADKKRGIGERSNRSGGKRRKLNREEGFNPSPQEKYHAKTIDSG